MASRNPSPSNQENLFLTIRRDLGKILAMRRVLAVILVVCFLPYLGFAQTRDDKRRVEEEKRKALQPSEAHVQKPFAQKAAVKELPTLAYLQSLLTQEVTTRYDLFRVVIILFGVEDQYRQTTDQIALLKEKNFLPTHPARDYLLNAPLTKGFAAEVFCRALNIRGGLWMRLLGINERRALKELVFENIASGGNVLDKVSGRELVEMFIQAANYLAQRSHAQANNVSQKS